MAHKRSLKLQCPTCHKPTTRQNPDFPFCSARCRLIDLGKWASGAYVISSPLRDTSDVPDTGKTGGSDDD